MRSEYGLSKVQESGLPDWTDGYDIAEFIDENGLDYDSIILDEGGNLVDGKPVSRGFSYVIRSSEQVKSAGPITYDDSGNVIPLTERFDSGNRDIRWSISSIVGDSGKDYGTGVVLDSTLLDNLSPDERVDMVKEYVKELGGQPFTAFDKNGLNDWCEGTYAFKFQQKAYRCDKAENFNYIGEEEFSFRNYFQETNENIISVTSPVTVSESLKFIKTKTPS